MNTQEPQNHNTHISTIKKLMKVKDGKVFATSLAVAQAFGKKHQHVLRDIKALEIPAEWHLSNFGQASYSVDQPNGGKATYPMVEMTRDGFTLLAMGFTGSQAMKFKIAYIEAFNQMEAELRRIKSEPLPAPVGNFPLYDPPVVVDGGIYGQAVVNRAAMLMQINREQALQLLLATGLTSCLRQIDRIPEQDRRELALKVELLKARPQWRNIYYYKVRGLNHQEIATLCKENVRTIRRAVRKMEELGLLYREA